MRSCTQERIQHYFPGVFHDIVHANDLTPEAVPKGVLAQQLGADRHIDDHIDDHIDYALSTLEYGIPSLLMTKPWNSSFSTKEHESLHRVASRQEALAILENHA